MKLSLREYDAMQSGWRKWINEHMEIGGFTAVKRCNYAGLDFCFKFQKENADCSVLSGNPYQ